ncbi:MAG: ribonuclease catalytic domain-containing protein, partial [Methanoregula sp.]
MKTPRSIDLYAIAENAMKRYGFIPKFPAPVLEEVKRIAALPASERSSGNPARDLRSFLWSSIDNSDSMDLDQMEYCEPGADGEIRVWIAIADVDTCVRQKSRADEYAAHNGTSVYTGVVTFPMLPDILSKGITSLLPGQDCPAIVIEYTVLVDGSVRHGDIYRATVANKAKLIYEQVGDWLDGRTPIPESVRNVPGLEEQIRLQAEATIHLRKYRMAQGALDLETIEAQPVLEDGVVKDLVVQSENMARHLIEEFMIAANGAMVNYLGNAGVPMIQRVVRSPKYWDKIMLVAMALGTTLPEKPDSKALADFLMRERESDPARFPDLSLTVIKLIGAGEYMTLEPGEPPYGHFGLAVTDYTHGTAPNRRYVDLIIQRLIKSILDRVVQPYTLDDLTGQALWLTDREKGSKKVERFMRKAAAAVLLMDRIGESFEAFVTGASEKGTYVRLMAIPAEGRVISG